MAKNTTSAGAHGATSASQRGTPRGATGEPSRAVAYLRVSTDRQGATGLGIEAQREAVRTWAAQRGATVFHEYVEVESGKRAERPRLAEALAHARRTGACLVVAKLDRLTRDVGFLQAVQQSGARVAFCDLPEADGPVGEMLPLLMAWVAQLEARMISHRTKAALAQARVRLAAQGRRLGNPNGAAALLRYHAAREAQGEPHKGTQQAAANARERARDMAAVIADLHREGFTSHRALSAELNRRGIAAPRGGAWHPTAVARLLKRLGAVERGERASAGGGASE